MRFDMVRPCSDCPFLKVGGIKVRRARIREIAGYASSSQGATFACHKSVDYGESDDDEPARRNRKDEQHCAGALIFMERVNPAGTQMIRIAERLGLYDRHKLDPAAFAKVWDSLRQWLKGGVC